MKALIIGYGSIGKRHEEVLASMDSDYEIHIVTKQNLESKITFKDLDAVNDLSIYDYFIIASETYKHYDQLEYLNSKLKNKIIFCEKPLFEKFKPFGNINNKIYIGYVLRFHPLMLKLKEMLSNEKIITASIKCGQYLPGWRPNIDYRDSYSAKKDEGGGVLLDLSHEIDYCQWLFGKLSEIKSYQLKISDLEIDSDDIAMFIGKTKNGVLINLSVDYISKITHREIIVETMENTYELDFVANSLKQNDKFGNSQLFEVKYLERNDFFISMHSSILSDGRHACTMTEGLDVMHTIKIIQEQNI